MEVLRSSAVAFTVLLMPVLLTLKKKLKSVHVWVKHQCNGSSQTNYIINISSEMWEDEGRKEKKKTCPAKKWKTERRVHPGSRRMHVCVWVDLREACCCAFLCVFIFSSFPSPFLPFASCFCITTACPLTSDALRVCLQEECNSSLGLCVHRASIKSAASPQLHLLPPPPPTYMRLFTFFTTLQLICFLLVTSYVRKTLLRGFKWSRGFFFLYFFIYYLNFLGGVGF